MTTSGPEPNDDATGGTASGPGATRPPDTEPPTMPGDPYAARPYEAPPQQPAPYGLGQSPGDYSGPVTGDVSGWRPGPRNGFGIAALVLGIVSILLFPGLGIILGLLGIIFGILGIRLASKGEATNNGMAIAGVVLSAVGLALGALLIGFAVTYWPRVDDCLDRFSTSQQREDCIKDKLPDWMTTDDT
jgi:Domain of unknown function (DUF4190)